MYAFQNQFDLNKQKTFSKTKTLCSKILKSKKTVMLTPHPHLLIGCPLFATLVAAEQSKPLGQDRSEIIALLFYLWLCLCSLFIGVPGYVHTKRSKLCKLFIVLMCEERNAQFPKLPEMSNGTSAAVLPVRSL